MPRYFLTRLSIEGFRGVNNESDPLDLVFRPDAVNSVYAANGCGKSSIFEALYYAIYGDLKKLESLYAEERPQDYYCNRFHSQKTASILLKLEPDDGSKAVSIKVKRDSSGSRSVTSPSGHPDPKGLLRTLQEAFVFLDYPTFIRFIENSPLKRGRTFSSLIGLAEYSDCRQVLEALSDTRACNTDFDIKILANEIETIGNLKHEAIAQLRGSYESICNKSLDDVGKLDGYVADIIDVLSKEELLKCHIVGNELVDIDFDQMKSKIGAADNKEKHSELAQTIQSIASLKALAIYDREAIKTDQDEISVLAYDLQKLLNSTPGEHFRRLYDSAKDVISQKEWKEDEVCPLCDTQLSISISKYVDEQLIRYEAVFDKHKQIEAKWESSTWKKSLAGHEATAVLGVESSDKKLSSVDDTFSSASISRDDIKNAIAWTSSITKMAIKELEELQKKELEIRKLLPDSLVALIETLESSRQFVRALERYNNYQVEEVSLKARLNVRERWKTFISQAAKSFASAEEILANARIKGIESKYKSIFYDIMNDGQIVPSLRRAGGREDLHLQLSDFYGQADVSARALLSESYRNALAISLFLVAALKHSGAPRFIVLDDVTSNFDSGHQFLLMELIMNKLQQPNNSTGLQFIILSHDGVLEKYFDRVGGQANWHHNKLGGSPPQGLIINHVQGAERLKTTIMSHLDKNETYDVEHLIRQYLEYTLLQIIRKVNIPVPVDFVVRDTSKMVKNCYDAISVAVKLHEAAGKIVLTKQQITDFRNVHMPAIVANWLSHYETRAGANFSASVLKAVVSAIDALSDCFKYTDDSGGTKTIRWYRSLSSR